MATSITTFSIMRASLTTLSIVVLNVTLGTNDSQNKGTENNEIV